MTSEQIRAMPSDALRGIVNGMAYALGATWADRAARLIAQGELDDRRRLGRA